MTNFGLLGWECEEIIFKLGLKSRSLLDGREKSIQGGRNDTKKAWICECIPHV